MPALKKTQIEGRITWIGCVENSDAGIRSKARDSAELTFEGLVGESHSGLTRPACIRTADQYAEGTEIRNVRQLSVLSAEEMQSTADRMGLDSLDPQLLGVSLVVEGIPDFTHVPPSSRLQFQSGATITVDMENRPCLFPAKEIEKEHEGFGKAFKPAAEGKRGVTAWVERPGAIKIGDTVTLHIPDQPVWAHLEKVRND